MSSAAQTNFTKYSSRRQRNARTLRAYMALRNQEIAQRIKDLREARGNPPQPVVAQAVGVSLRTYQNWEGGDAKPEYRNLESLAAYFDVSEEFILSGVVRKPKPDGTPDPFAGTSDLAETLELIQRQLEVNGEALEVLLGGLANGGVAEEPQLEAALNHLVELRRYVEAHRQTA